jgi:hypothetical protein
LHDKLNLDECGICHQLLPKTHLKKLIYTENLDFIKDLFDKDNLNVCKEYCLKDINMNQIPKYSKLNNMLLNALPEEISNLNSYELLLIQLAKCYMTIIKLKTHQNTNAKSLISAIKGNNK